MTEAPDWELENERDCAVYRILLDQLTTATTTFIANHQGRPVAPRFADLLQVILGAQFTIVDSLDRYSARQEQADA